MRIMDHELYPLYESYLADTRLAAPSKKLMLICGAHFEEFVKKYESNPFFRSKYQAIFKNLIREKKIRSLSGKNDKETNTGVGRAEA